MHQIHTVTAFAAVVAMNLKQRFGHHLRTLRNARQITQSQLAEACGTSVETISNIERGIHGPRLELQGDIAAALNIPLYQLFTFDN